VMSSAVPGCPSGPFEAISKAAGLFLSARRPCF
jgi:hypothetical protein